MSRKICVFGSSITRGFWFRDQGSWVQGLLVELESSEKRKTLVYNLGVSNETTSSLLKRIDVECEARNPDIIIIDMATNDASYRESLKGNFVPIGKYEDNLGKILDKSRKHAEKIVFIGLTPVDERKTNPLSWDENAYYKNESLLEYNKVLEDFCERNNILFINIIDLIHIKKDLFDGLHPNAEGHKKIFLRVKKHLIEYKII